MLSHTIFFICMVAALGVFTPAAVMAGHESETDDMPHTVITTVCSVYTDYLNTTVTTLSDVLGVSEMYDEFYCNVATEHYAPEIKPLVSGNVSTVSMPSGAGYPDCLNTGICFVPARTTIQLGDSVEWINNDHVQHTVTESGKEKLFDSWILPGNSFTHTFDTDGTYHYSCKVHPWAAGTVVVLAPHEDIGLTDKDLSIVRVNQYIELYKMEGEAAFDEINAKAQNAVATTAVTGFAMRIDDNTVVAHDSNLAYIGLRADTLLAKAFIPLSDLIEMLMEEEGNIIPLSYPLPDPQGNIIGYESGQFIYHDGYIFGARFNPTPQERAQDVVGEIIRLYNRNPAGAFDSVNAFMSTSDNYPFILDVNTSQVVAHGNDPYRVGTPSKVLTNSTIPPSLFHTWNNGDGGWAEYHANKPGETTESLKISWLVMHDGYIFGAGYYP